ncbi:MAG: ATP-dependent DNA helicase RecG [Natronospirillum sp.]
MTTAARAAALTQLKGVGPSLVEKLGRLGVQDITDLLFHLPLRYEDRTRIWSMGQLHPGQHVLLRGTVVRTQVQFGRRRSLLVKIRDDSGEVGMRLFYFNKAQQAALQPGAALQVFGEARRGATGLELYHPEYVLASTLDALPRLDGRLTPVYPTTDGLSQKKWRELIDQALQWLTRNGHLRDLIPPELRARWQLPDLPAALAFLHHPPLGTDPETLREGEHPCVARLVVEELLAHHLGLRQIRARTRAESAPDFHPQGDLGARLRTSLPFQLTGAQQRVLQEIFTDLERPVPMLRLVQGDVGSGKTLVALCAMLRVMENGWQAALLAPTEILAEQHARNLQALLQPLGIAVVLLLGKHTRKQRDPVLAAIASGDAVCIVGTHALFQEEVQYARLGMVVVDEQHRFGVDQRLSLREKGRQLGKVPHQLIMTATPIPRTLAMSMYADLDISVIDELPPGRTPVVTSVLSNAQRTSVVARVQEACAQQRQVYWVCTLIEDSEELEAQAAEELYAQLAAALVPWRVGLIHGRMKPKDKADIMGAFQRGEVQVLVATTVIEVGVDVPNASVMIIENAERLGLSQLHQLRGRVGRGATASFCLLLYQTPLSQAGKARLNTMRATNDGFQIAEQDLLLRGPGEVLGTRQTGEASFRIADLQRDQHWLPVIKEVAETMEHSYAESVALLLARWHAGDMNYGKV